MTGYVIVGGIGIGSIALAKLEQNGIKRGNIVQSRLIKGIGGVILPIIAIGAMIFVGHFVENIWF